MVLSVRSIAFRSIVFHSEYLAKRNNIDQTQL